MDWLYQFWNRLHIYNALSSSVAGAGHSQLKHCHHLDIMENSNNHKQILEQKLCIMLDETNEGGNGNWGNELKEKVFEWEAFSSAPQVALKHLWLRGVLMCSVPMENQRVFHLFKAREEKSSSLLTIRFCCSYSLLNIYNIIGIILKKCWCHLFSSDLYFCKLIYLLPIHLGACQLSRTYPSLL